MRRNIQPRGDVAIVGMACNFPQAPTVGALWEKIVAGVDVTGEMSPERVMTESADPEERLALKTAHEALRDAGYDPQQMESERVEVRAAIETGVRDLLSGTCDTALLGDAVGMLVCKRLEDARQAGDRIYAVIKGIGTAEIDPATVGLIEAGGTGAAGLIKAALALYHKILPPATPWIHGGREHPRRAGISALGGDGVTAPVLLEEYRETEEDEHPGWLRHWPTELCLLDADDRPGLLRKARELAGDLAAPPPGMELHHLAATLNGAQASRCVRLAIVAESLLDLREKLVRACARLEDPECSQIEDLHGIYYFAQPLGAEGKLAILFPGIGAQYVGMLRDLCIHFPVVRRVFDRVDGVSSVAHLFPPPVPEERERAKQRLWSSTSSAVQAVLAANLALYSLFQRLHLRPDAVLGHSNGELFASLAAGILPNDGRNLDRLSRLWGAYDDASQSGAGSGMLAVGAGQATALAQLEELAVDLTVTMDNSPRQVLLAGPTEVIDRASERLQTAGIMARRLPFPQPYHTEAFRPCLSALRESLEKTPLNAPTRPIYSCSTADVYPTDVREVRHLLLDHGCRPVRFQETIRKMYADGVRLFLELGPSGHLTTFVADILRGLPHLAVSADRPRRHGLTQLNHVVALLYAHGVSLQLDELYARRSPQRVEGRRPALERSDPMIDYMQTMEQFLLVQQSVMEALLQPAVGEIPFRMEQPSEAVPTPDSESYPLLGTITSYCAGQELQAERILSLDTDLFLLDHSFGRKISVDPKLRPIATVPATVSMEIMAEAASALRPGLKVIGIERFRSLRWINVTERPTTLRITARRLGEPEAGADRSAPVPTEVVEVTIWSSETGSAGTAASGAPGASAIERAQRGSEHARGRDSDGGSDGVSPAAQGLVRLGAEYPAGTSDAPFSLQNPRPCGIAGTQPYEWLFHGPQFHAIRAVHQVGEDGLSAELTTTPMERFLGARGGAFAPGPSHAMILDPAVLDGAGQLMAVWAREQIADQGMMFPLQIDEVVFYGPRYHGPTLFPCHLRVLRCDYRQVLANLEVIGPDGRVHIRIAGCQKYRIHCPAHRMRGSLDTRPEFTGELWDVPTVPLPSGGNYVAILVDGFSEKGSLTMEESCAYRMLGRAEREQWWAFRGPKNRRAQWLLGRVAAKDALRAHLLRQYGVELYPADVEITADGNGRPRVMGAWTSEVPSLPALSLAHTGTIGVAVAGGTGPDDSLGIDIERVRPRDPGFMELAFTREERAWLEALEESARWEWVARYWCAKEAVAKAVGQGLVDGPKGITVQHVDARTGRLELRLGGTLARINPDLREVPLVAYSARSGDLVVATTVCEKAR